MNIFLTSLISTRFSILRMLFAGDKQYFQPIKNQTNFFLIFDLVNCKIGLENSFISINWGSECLIEILIRIIIFYRWREINFCSYTGVSLYLLGLIYYSLNKQWLMFLKLINEFEVYGLQLSSWLIDHFLFKNYPQYEKIITYSLQSQEIKIVVTEINKNWFQLTVKNLRLNFCLSGVTVTY